MARWMARLLNFEAARPAKGADEILSRLGLRAGMAVADVGAGGGYFTFLFSRAVGEKGAVYAVETKPDFLDFIQKQAGKMGLGNIRTVPGGKEALSLPEAGIDLAFLRNVFHHLADPIPFLEGLKGFLKPTGKIAIIDHGPGSRGGFVRAFRHFTPEEDIIRAAEKAGYRLVEKYHCLPGQSFLVFGLSARERRN